MSSRSVSKLARGYYLIVGLMVFGALAPLVTAVFVRHQHQRRTQVLIDAIETAVRKADDVPRPSGILRMSQAEDAQLAREVGALCESGALVNGRGRGQFGYFGDPRIELTPLHLTADWNLPKTAGVLIDHGADPNALDSDGLTPLHWAARLQDPVNSGVPVTQVLIRNGADVNYACPRGWTALDYAAEFGLRHDLGPALRKAGAIHSLEWQRASSQVGARISMS